MYELSRAILADRDGVILVLRVYLDESGTHDPSPVVVVGGYVAKPSTWKAWTKEWERELSPVQIYHAVDCSNRAGEFAGWSVEKRNSFVAKMLPIIPRYIKLGVAVGINMDAFRAAMAPHPELAAMFPSPYAACFQWLVEIILEELDLKGGYSRVSFVHESNDYQYEALEAFNAVKNYRPEKNRLISLVFAGKSLFTPLQSADILAYEANHIIRDPVKTRRKSWDALSPNGRGIKLMHYGRANMGELTRLLSGLRERLLASGWDGVVEQPGRSLRKPAQT